MSSSELGGVIMTPRAVGRRVHRTSGGGRLPDHPGPGAPPATRSRMPTSEPGVTFEGYAIPTQFDAWLHLTVNACLDAVRKRRRRPIEVDLEPLSPPMIGGESAMIADRDQLERGFRRLRTDHRAILVQLLPRDVHLGDRRDPGSPAGHRSIPTPRSPIRDACGLGRRRAGRRPRPAGDRGVNRRRARPRAPHLACRRPVPRTPAPR